ncbi:helix-turn-helix transcriptional regulator [Litoribrevibacter albus]
MSEATLERWRSEGIGPIYVKLGGQVRYRRKDVLEYESYLRKSTFEAV